jgi:hypothetical protein
VIPLLGIYSKEFKSGNNRNTCITLFIAALFTTVKQWIQRRGPISDEWIKKLCLCNLSNYLCIYIIYPQGLFYLSIRIEGHHVK